MIVLKFGGTSVGSVESLRSVVEIVRSRMNKAPIVVVSALSKVTDLLYKICEKEESFEDDLKALRLRHHSFIEEYFAESPQTVLQLKSEIDTYVNSITDICIQPEFSYRDRAAVISCGELMSSLIACTALNKGGVPTSRIDARQFMFCNGDPLKSSPDMSMINHHTPALIARHRMLNPDSKAIITQGFICATISGKPAVLGRGGSDYSASIIAWALNADAVEIWTDVNGIRDADPRYVENTHCLPLLSYDQADAIVKAGAKVLHPLTLEPARMRNIPVYVLNTYNPEGEYTLILPEDHKLLKRYESCN